MKMGILAACLAASAMVTPATAQQSSIAGLTVSEVGGQQVILVDFGSETLPLPTELANRFCRGETKSSVDFRGESIVWTFTKYDEDAGHYTGTLLAGIKTAVFDCDPVAVEAVVDYSPFNEPELVARVAGRDLRFKKACGLAPQAVATEGDVSALRVGSTVKVSLPTGQAEEFNLPACYVGATAPTVAAVTPVPIAEPTAPAEGSADLDEEPLIEVSDPQFCPEGDYLRQIWSAMHVGHTDAFATDQLAPVVEVVCTTAAYPITTHHLKKAPRKHKIYGHDVAVIEGILKRHDDQVTGWRVRRGDDVYFVLQGVCTNVCDGPLAVYAVHTRKVIVPSNPTRKRRNKNPPTQTTPSVPDEPAPIHGQNPHGACFKYVAGEKKSC